MNMKQILILILFLNCWMLTAQTNLKDTFNLKKSNKEYSLSINGYFGEFYISFDSKNKLKEYLYKLKKKINILFFGNIINFIF